MDDHASHASQLASVGADQIVFCANVRIAFATALRMLQRDSGCDAASAS